MDYPIFDGHNDSLLHVHLSEEDGGRSFLERSDQGHLDLPRAREGGFAGGMFAIFAPPKPLPNGPGSDLTITEQGYEVRMAAAMNPKAARDFTMSVAAELFRLERRSNGQIEVVRSADQLQRCLDDGTLAVVFHIEGACAIDTDLDLLHVLYEAGLRSLGPVWSRPNAFGHGVPFCFPRHPDTGPGLTDAGKRLVKACNELGVQIDLSHITEKGFWDVAKLSEHPLVATHSSVHALCPSARNLTDAQLDAIGESGGVVGINFFVADLRDDGRLDPDTPIDHIVRHVDYVAERIGIDHVAFGSDFDGAMMPRELGDAAGLPVVVEALVAAGYDDQALRKVTHENWIRVLRACWGR
jgi:membrane dipeptidase